MEPRKTPLKKKTSQSGKEPNRARFQIEKLEERIAPSKHGYHCNKKHPCY